jgi:hypothetical protein
MAESWKWLAEQFEAPDKRFARVGADRPQVLARTLQLLPAGEARSAGPVQPCPLPAAHSPSKSRRLLLKSCPTSRD